ncbi:MAG: HYR domain-containing protein, partial [Flavobacteriales bacterium]|nr:HYR domain-containing protein [Flavobacteriales bacterium]
MNPSFVFSSKNKFFAHATTGLILSLSVPHFSVAQLVVDDFATNAAMIAQLEGSGINIIDASFTVYGTAHTRQLGLFTNTPSAELPLTNGVVFSTGYGSDAIGPNNTGGGNYTDASAGTYSDPDLILLEASATRDVIFVEFDFIPKLDTLQIEFVFASEEYPEWVCSGYNDAFAFFVSGPGIAGPFSGGAENFAQLPDGTYVSIDNVNDVGTCVPNHSPYYYNNTGGVYLQADGLTIGLTAFGVVQPCQTYHAKIILADAGDSVWDSWVFLKDFSSLGQSVVIDADATFGQAVEGCASSLFTVTRSGDIGVSLPVTFTLGGTATFNTDYTLTDLMGNPFSTSFTFAPGETTKNFWIQPVADCNVEGSESVVITYIWTVCSEPFSATSTYSIDDPWVNLVCPSNITVTAPSGTCSAIVNSSLPTGTSNCSISLSRIDGGPAFGSSWPVGIYTVTYRGYPGSYSAGGLNCMYDDCSFTVTVNDQNAPTITCPGNQTLTMNSLCQVTIPNYIALVTATDICDVSLTITQSPVAGTVVTGAASTTITMTATDDSGNSASCTFQLTKNDFTTAIIICPSNINAIPGVGLCYAAVTVPVPSVTDCSTYTLVNSFNGTGNATGNYPEGTTTVVWTVTDVAGNVSTCSHTVTVSQSTAYAWASAVNDPNSCVTATEQAFWQTLAAITATGNDLLKTGAAGLGNSNAFSLNDVSNNGWVTMTVVETNTERYFGISAVDAGNGSGGIDYAIRLRSNGLLRMYENGTNMGDFGAYAANDVLRIAIENNVVRYYRNATLLYSSLVIPASVPFFVDCAMNETNSSLNDIFIINPFCGTFAAGSSGISGTLAYQWYLNGSPVGTNSSTYTNSSLADNAQVTVTVSNGGLCSETSAAVVVDVPAMSCSGSNITTTTSGGLCSAPVTIPNPTVTGTCTGYSVTNNFNGTTNASGTYPLGTTTVVFTISTSCGTFGTCSITVTVNDDDAPTITCPATQSLILDATCSGAMGNYTTLAIVSDNCTASGSIVVTQSPAAGYAVTGAGVVPVILTATDAAGNFSTCTFNVNVIDNSTPTFATCPPDQTLNLNASCQATIGDYTGLATIGDNCSLLNNPGASYASANSGNLGGNNDGGTTPYTFTYTPAAGVNRLIALTITFENEGAAPTYGLNNFGTVMYGNKVMTQVANVSLFPAGQNGSRAAVYYLKEADIATVVGNTFNIPWTLTGTSPTNYSIHGICADVFMLQNISQTTPIEDVQTATASPNVTSVTVPSALPANQGDFMIAVCNSGTSTSNVNAPATYTMLSEINVTGSHVHAVAYKELTASGNQQPSFTTVASTARLLMASIEVNSNGYITYSQTPPAGTLITGVGITPVIVVATDASNNTDTCFFNVNAVDVTNPTITCPGAQTLVLNSSCTATLGNYVSLATTSDNCSAVTVTQSPISGSSVSGVGTTTVTITATDASGNTSSCTFSVNRLDNTNPTITCPAAQTIVLNASCAGVLGNYTSLATTADNCSALTVTQSPAAGTAVSGVGTTTVTLTATDASGNTSNCTFSVNRVDTTPPTITCPPNITIPTNGNSCIGTLSNALLGTPVTSDNCGVASVTNNHPSASYNAGPNTITWTVTDNSGNTATCLQTLVVVDNEPPVIACPAAQTIVLNASCARVLGNYTALATTADNCSAVTVTQSPAAGTAVSGVGTTTVTLTATDASGNATTCTFSVNRVDNTNPTITCPVAQTILLNSSCAGALGNYTALATTSDNCSAVVVTQSPSSGTA